MGHSWLFVACLALPSIADRDVKTMVVTHNHFQHLHQDLKSAANASNFACDMFEDAGDAWETKSEVLGQSSSKAALDGIRGALGILPQEDEFTPAMCTKRDVCLLMKQLDFKNYIEASGKMVTRDTQQWWYYSPYKLKKSMKIGGTIANSAACSFGAMAELYRRGWTSSACAHLMTYRGSDIELREYRMIFMNIMSNVWCPQNWKDAMQRGNVCIARRMGRGEKYVLKTNACENVPDAKLTDIPLSGEAGRQPLWPGEIPLTGKVDQQPKQNWGRDNYNRNPHNYLSDPRNNNRDPHSYNRNPHSYHHDPHKTVTELQRKLDERDEVIRDLRADIAARDRAEIAARDRDYKEISALKSEIAKCELKVLKGGIDFLKTGDFEKSPFEKTPSHHK